MSENKATKEDLAKAIAIYGKDEAIVWKALNSLAEDEYFSGLTDERLWASAVAFEVDETLKMPPAVSEDHVLDASVLDHPMHKAVLDTYCYFRGAEILLEAQACGDAKLKEQIKRVEEIQKRCAKPRNSSDVRTQTSRQTLTYLLALLIVGLLAILLGGNGA